MDIAIIITKLKEEMKTIFAQIENVPTKTSDLINDNNFMTQIQDTGWQNVTCEDGFQTPSKYKARYRRIGKIVYLEGVIYNTNTIPSVHEIKIGNISDYYCRPAHNQYATHTVLDQDSQQKTYTFMLNIEPDGDILIYYLGGNNDNIEIPASTRFKCNMSWIIEQEGNMVGTNIDVTFNETWVNIYTDEKRVNFTATLTDQNNNALQGKTIDVYRGTDWSSSNDDIHIGTFTTNNQGIISLSDTADYTNTDYIFTFMFNQYNQYKPSSKKIQIEGQYSIDDM